MKIVCLKCKRELETKSFKYDRVKHRYSKICKECEGVDYAAQKAKYKRETMVRKFRALWLEISAGMDSVEVDRQLFLLRDSWEKGRKL